MPVVSYRTAGESHGPALIAIVDGLPAAMPVDVPFIDGELRRRQGGYGRSARQRIEVDRVEFLSGVRQSRTIGSPVAMMIANRDNRLEDASQTPPLHRPRPGHADMAGAIKWLTTDCRDTLERASARETAARTAAGALSRCLLREFGIEAFGFVRAIGSARGAFEVTPANWRALLARRDASDVYCPDEAASAQMRDFIRQRKEDKDTAGGIVECHVFGCPIGLGSCANWYQKLDARIAGAVMGIQAIKGVEIGLGFGAAERPGSAVHDELFYDASQRSSPAFGFVRKSNNAGGLEGGMTNGQPIIVRAAMKPISTLGQPLRSVDLQTKEAVAAGWERSDIAAVAAASVIMENVVAFEVAAAVASKFGGDSLPEMQRNYEAYLAAAREL